MLSSSVNTTHSASAPLSSQSDSHSYLTATLRPLLALICSHLPVSDLLRLLRCCSALRPLSASDAAFNGVAWSAAQLHIDLETRLSQWAVPPCGCIDGERIPLLLWRQALPVMRYTLEWRSGAESSDCGDDDENEEWEQLWTTVTAKHPTTTTTTTTTTRGKSRTARREVDFRASVAFDQPTTTVRVGGEECVVLRQLTWSKLNAIAPKLWMVSHRSLFVLRATPQLQHLRLDCGILHAGWPPCSDIALVPHLRSLHLEPSQANGVGRVNVTMHIVCMLSLLPRLTTLRCVSVPLAKQDLIDIAAHATLEHITLSGCELRNPREFERLGGQPLHFDTDSMSEEAEAEEGKEEEGDVNEGGDVHSVEWDDGAADFHAREAVRLTAALTRVPPSHRSIGIRFALADFVHQKMRKTPAVAIAASRHAPEEWDYFAAAVKEHHDNVEKKSSTKRAV